MSRKRGSNPRIILTWNAFYIPAPSPAICCYSEAISNPFTPGIHNKAARQAAINIFKIFVTTQASHSPAGSQKASCDSELPTLDTRSRTNGPSFEPSGATGHRSPARHHSMTSPPAGPHRRYQPRQCKGRADISSSILWQKHLARDNIAAIVIRDCSSRRGAKISVRIWYFPLNSNRKIYLPTENISFCLPYISVFAFPTC